MCHDRKRYSAAAAVAAMSCGVAMLLAAAAVDAQVRGRDGSDRPRGPMGRVERPATTAVPPPPPSVPPGPVDGKGNPPPGPIARLPVDGNGVNHFPGPNAGILMQDGAASRPPVQNKSFALGRQADTASSIAAPASTQAPVQVTTSAATDSSAAAGRISEIIPDSTYASVLAQPQQVGPDVSRRAAGADASTRAAGCVNVVVRSSTIDGNDVVSIDLQGDGLIKSRVSPQLALELLASAGARSASGIWTTCVSQTLAQRLFDPAINLAGFDSAVRIKQVGDRWLLASGDEPDLALMPPEQLAALTPRTRGPAKVKAKAKRARVPAVHTTLLGPKPAPKEGAIRLTAAGTAKGHAAQVQANMTAKPRRESRKRTAEWFYP